MYSMNICNGTRPVVGVEVTAVDIAQKAIWVKGSKYNSDLGQWTDCPLGLRVGPFAEPKLSKINVGDIILAKIMFDEGSTNTGTVEEIALKGETVITYSQKNNKKFVSFSKVNGVKVYNKPDGSGKMSIQFSFKNPINAKDGTYLGTEFTKTNEQGQTISSYWLNSSLFFNSPYETAYTAEKAESEIGQGDTIICVTTEKPSKKDPSKMNYSCDKFIVLEKAEAMPVGSDNPFPELPGITSPISSVEANANIPSQEASLMPNNPMVPNQTPITPIPTPVTPVAPIGMPSVLVNKLPF